MLDVTENKTGHPHMFLCLLYISYMVKDVKKSYTLKEGAPNKGSFFFLGGIMLYDYFYFFVTVGIPLLVLQWFLYLELYHRDRVRRLNKLTETIKELREQNEALQSLRRPSIDNDSTSN